VNKTALLETIRAALLQEFESLRDISRQTRAGGNDEESRAEDKYDTLSTEQNYLADGLAKQAHTAREALAAFDKLAPRDFAPTDPVDLGAAVQIAFPDESPWFFLAPAGGGTEVQLGDKRVTLITPESPLGQQLTGKVVGDLIPSPPARVVGVG
jgi:transcription elongation GreA/GreB family factor